MLKPLSLAALKFVPLRPVVIAVLAGAALTVWMLRGRGRRSGRVERVEPRPAPDIDVPWGG